MSPPPASTGGHRSGPNDFFVEVPPSVAAVPDARRAFVAWLWALDDGVVRELEIVFSELVTNAVQASQDAPAAVEVRARRDVGVVTLEVVNATTGHWDLTTRGDSGDRLRSSGRGLMIVEALVDDLQVSRTGAEIKVSCSRRIDPT